ncbi:hypothetical protein [Sphingomonas sp. CLY1604]|uniref:hypothetical protein n=1 Tax=Sphingomonas sp. CLY1604 TaxID=3457786 RepID=UPI003FD7CCEC
MVTDTGGARRILGEALVSLERLSTPAGELAASLVSMAMEQIDERAGCRAPAKR